MLCDLCEFENGSLCWGILAFIIIGASLLREPHIHSHDLLKLDGRLQIALLISCY
jgi:hypothetical protein